MNLLIRGRNLRRGLLAVWTLLTGCVGGPPASLPPVAAGDEGAVRRLIAEEALREMQANDIAGLSIALVDDQRLVWAAGFGDADREQKVPATAETLYRAGSISKLFTTVAALQLVQQGRWDIDAPLSRGLPGFALRGGGEDSITPRHLMTHHAGLPADWLQGMWTTGQPAPFTDVMPALRDTGTISAPGLMLSYSNLGFTLLGHAVQNVAGRPYAEHLRETLLTPMGMDGASFETGLTASPRMARGHEAGRPALEPVLRDVPAGGLNASVIDLGRFMSMVFAEGRSGSRQVLSPDLVAEMLRPQNEAVPLDLGFRVGLGWMLDTFGPEVLENAGPVAHHAGATQYFHSQMSLLPEHKLGVVVMSNDRAARATVDRLAHLTLALALEAKTGIRQPDLAVPPRTTATWPRERLRAMEGDYATRVGFVRVRLDGDRLRAQALGRRFDLVPRNGQELGLEYAVLGLWRIGLGALDAMHLSLRTVAGREVLVARSGRQEVLIGSKLPPPAPLGAWRSRLGDWRIDNLGQDFPLARRIRLVEEEGRLLVELTPSGSGAQPVRLPVLVMSDDELRVLDTLAPEGEVLRRVPTAWGDRLFHAGYLLRRAEGP